MSWRICWRSKAQMHFEFAPIADNAQSMTDLLAEGQDLSKLPGIGKAIAERMQAIAASSRGYPSIVARSRPLRRMPYPA